MVATSYDLAPRLRHRVDLQRLTTPIDPTTGQQGERAWETVLEPGEELLPAEVVPMSGREYITAQQSMSGVNTRITIRRRPDVSAVNMRILHDGTPYDIRAVLPDPSLRHHVTLVCSSGLTDG